jgi:hypothetical protein
LFFGPFAFRDVASGAGNCLDPTVGGKHRHKNVLVVPRLSRGSGKWRVIAQGLPGVDHLLNLALKTRRQFQGVTEVEEILAQRLFERFLPEGEQGVVSRRCESVMLYEKMRVGPLGVAL